jgi:hypothetical protein
MRGSEMINGIGKLVKNANLLEIARLAVYRSLPTIFPEITACFRWQNA